MRNLKDMLRFAISSNEFRYLCSRFSTDHTTVRTSHKSTSSQDKGSSPSHPDDILVKWMPNLTVFKINNSKSLPLTLSDAVWLKTSTRFLRLLEPGTDIEFLITSEIENCYATRSAVFDLSLGHQRFFLELKREYRDHGYHAVQS